MGIKSNDSYKLPSRSISLRLVNSCLGVSQWNLSEYIKIVIGIRYVNLSGFASDVLKLSFIAKYEYIILYTLNRVKLGVYKLVMILFMII